MATVEDIQQKYQGDKSLEAMGAFGPFSKKDVKGLNKAFSYANQQKTDPSTKAVQRIENRRREKSLNVDWDKVKQHVSSILTAVKNASSGSTGIGNDSMALNILSDIEKSARKLDDLASRRKKGSLIVR